jgi:hypothetical protein
LVKGQSSNPKKAEKNPPSDSRPAKTKEKQTEKPKAPKKTNRKDNTRQKTGPVLGMGDHTPAFLKKSISRPK